MASKPHATIIFSSYYNLTSACPNYQKCWMCDETIFRLLNSHFPHLKNTFTFTRTGLNRALSSKAGLCTGRNLHGLYVAEFQTECPYFGKKREVSYYFRQATTDTQPPDDPQCVLDVVDKYASSKSNQLRRNSIRLGSNMPHVGLESGGGEGGGGGEEMEKGEGAWIQKQPGHQ